jgi:hypothetical protein
MHSYRTVWNDAAKRRDLEVVIRYRIDANQAEILEVVPRSVMLYEVEGESVFKQLPVHTDGGRRVLAKAYLAGRDSSQSLEAEVLAHHASKDDPLADAIAGR